MAILSKKQSVDERIVYLNDPARLDKRVILEEQNQKQLKLKQEGISDFIEGRMGRQRGSA